MEFLALHWAFIKYGPRGMPRETSLPNVLRGYRIGKTQTTRDFDHEIRRLAKHAGQHGITDFPPLLTTFAEARAE